MMSSSLAGHTLRVRVGGARKEREEREKYVWCISLAGHVFCKCASGARARERGRGKNTYGVSVQVFVH